MDVEIKNIFANIPQQLDKEQFLPLLSRPLNNS